MKPTFSRKLWRSVAGGVLGLAVAMLTGCRHSPVPTVVASPLADSWAARLPGAYVGVLNRSRLIYTLGAGGVGALSVTRLDAPAATGSASSVGPGDEILELPPTYRCTWKLTSDDELEIAVVLDAKRPIETHRFRFRSENGDLVGFDELASPSTGGTAVAFLRVVGSADPSRVP